jgi:hypothetical protein
MVNHIKLVSCHFFTGKLEAVWIWAVTQVYQPITEHRTSEGLYTLSMFAWFIEATWELSEVGRRQIGRATRYGWLHKSGPIYGKP